MSVSVSLGVPNTEKQMKVQCRRGSAHIVSRCLEPLMKQKVFDVFQSIYNSLVILRVLFLSSNLP